MDWPGLVGPSYRLESANAAPDECINRFLERIEQGPRAGKLRLRQIPGLRVFKTFIQSPMRALWAGDNRLFAVAGDTLYEVFQDATPSQSYGAMVTGTNPAVIASNGFQLAIATAGAAYITAGPAVVPILDTNGDPVQAATIAFLDQYFIAGIPNSKQIRISELAPDGGTWDPGNTAIKEAYSDNIVRVWVDQPGGELLWLFGQQTYEVWENTGGLFPFARINGAVFPIGCDSAWSVAGLEGSRFWLWNGQVWGAEGLAPNRISDYGVEEAIRGYSFADQTNAEGFCYSDGGRLFYALSFSQANVTWVYDKSVKAWAKRLYWNNGMWSRYRPRLYATCWGKDLVGDYQKGIIYEMASNIYTDAPLTADGPGIPLRRQRIAPYITDGMKNDRYNRLTLDMDTGVGLNVASGQPGYDPQITMRYSPDRGKTWSAIRPHTMGKQGKTLDRVFWTTMGSSRIGMTVDIVDSDPVLSSINGADIDISPGNYPRR